MTRTADRVIANGIELVAGLDDKLTRWSHRLNEGVRSKFDLTPVIVADNVAAYLRDGGAKGFCLEDIPCLAPPWPFFWIESLRVAPGSRQRQAFHVEGFDFRTEEHPQKIIGVKEATADAVANGFDADGLRFALLFVSYVEDRKQVIGPVGVMVLVLDEYGRCQGNHYYCFTPGQDAPDYLLTSMATALQTIAFLHCKNAVTDVVTPDPKLSRAHRRRHGHPLVDYRTLRLMVPRRASGGGSGGDGLGGLPMHIVPGHVAHYGNCCPGVHEPKGLLFGKLEGRYWIPIHLRGNPEHGTTRRDYNVVVSGDG